MPATGTMQACKYEYVRYLLLLLLLLLSLLSFSPDPFRAFASSIHAMHACTLRIGKESY